MKKIFFYASLLALATSCTDEFDSLNVQNEKAQGISFQSEAVESRMLWEDNGSAYVPFWFAEKDRIGIFAQDVKQGEFGSEATLNAAGEGGWTEFYTSATAANAVYKATQSKKNGVFTSTEDAQTLHFDGDKTANFLAVYPSGLKANWDATEKKILISNGVLPTASQTQTGLKGDNQAQVMYALTSASRTNDYDAVGETVNLAFNRPMKALVFSTANADDYTVTPEGAASSVFGNLLSIAVETLGYDGNENGVLGDAQDIAATALSYGTGAMYVDTLNYAASFKSLANPINTITLTLNQEWNDEALAIMAIMPNDRKGYASTDEPWTITYDFANITLTHKFDKIPAGTKFNSYMPVPALDIQDFEYLVTKKNSGNDRTLIVNGGTFVNIFDETGSYIQWNEAGYADGIPVTEFSKIVVDEDVVIGEAELALINGFTNVTDLTLKSVTELGSEALSNLTLLASIDMPLLTTIAEDAFYASHAMSTVLLPSFNFSFDADLTAKILKKTSLVKLDMSGVSTMRDVYPASGFSLAGYSLLETVIVQEGVEVGANAFYGCTALTTIDKAVNLVGSSAFAESGIAELKLTNTVIPVSAFANSKIETLLDKDGEALLPTEIKNNAFAGATALEYLDLSATTAIGENAFNAVATYKGAYLDETRGLNLLDVNATTVGAGAFQGTALEYVKFINLKDLKSNILKGISSLKEVKFAQVLNAAAKKVTVFGASTSTAKLFLNEDQGTNFYLGNVFSPQGAITETASEDYVHVTMSAIVFE